MKALVYDGSNLHFNAEYPDPPTNGDRVRVQVTRAGICNTDLELMRGYHNFTGVLGHEFVGLTPDGTRVAGEISYGCGACGNCHAGIRSQCMNRTTLGIREEDGVFAEFATFPPENLHPIPDAVSDDAAVFVEPVAAGLQTLHLTHISPHHRVVLIGAGKLGLVTAQVVALTGCDLHVVVRHDRQRELLSRWGIAAADEGTLAPNSFDVAIDITGTSEGFAAGLELVRPRGVIHLKSTYAGLPQADLTRAVVDEVQIHTSRCGPFGAAIRLMARGLIDVDSMIDARYPLSEGVAAIDHAARRGVLKVLLDIA